MRHRYLHAGVFVGLLALWWFLIVEFALDGNTLHSSLVFIALVVISTPLHLIALSRFSRMLRMTRKAELAELVPPGSSLFAENQRFRYMVRAVESGYLAILAGCGVYAYYHPAFQANHSYAKFVITYFFGTIAATAYLTWRDLRVLDHVKEIEASDTDAAVLHGVQTKKKAES